MNPLIDSFAIKAIETEYNILLMKTHETKVFIKMLDNEYEFQEFLTSLPEAPPSMLNCR